MKTWFRKTLSVGALAAGALLFAPGAAHADASSAATTHTREGGTVKQQTESGAWHRYDIYEDDYYSDYSYHRHHRYRPPVVPVDDCGNSFGMMGLYCANPYVANPYVANPYAANPYLAGSYLGLGGYSPLLGVQPAVGLGVTVPNGNVTASVESAKVKRTAPVNVPINLCGNAINILGGAAVNNDTDTDCGDETVNLLGILDGGSSRGGSHRKGR